MTNYERGLIEKLNQLIEEKYIHSESITDDLCLELGVSRSNLYRILKDNYQLSPSLYIRKIKLKKAKDLLKNSEMKIGEIAYFIGLDSPQNFTKYFTQEHGINPTEYRKKKLTAKQDVKIENKNAEATIVSPPLVIQKAKFSDSFSFYIPGIVVFTLTALGFYFWQKNYFDSGNESSIKTKNSIAIIPFGCNGFDNNGQICKAFNTEFYESLSKIKSLNLVKQNRDKDNSIEKYTELNNENLKVIYLIVGQISNFNNLSRIKIELLDAKVEQTIWSKTFTLNEKERLKQMAIIANEISEILSEKTELTHNEKLYLIPTKNMITYKQYLQGSRLIFDWGSQKLE